MTDTDPQAVNVDRASDTASPVRAYGRFWPVLAVVMVAAILRDFIWLNSDVSWLLTLGEKMLAGARAYVDFNETNPPASIFLYLPAVLIAQILGVSAECIVVILLFAGCFFSLWLVGWILPRDVLPPARGTPALLALACVLLLILPGDNFAEREHIALLAILPMLAVYTARAGGAPVHSLLAGVAGIGGGMAVAIKPYFALALILPLLYVAWCWNAQRQKLSVLIFQPEHLAATLVILSYGALLYLAFSAYLDRALPLVLELYVPLKYSLWLMLINPSVILVVVAAMLALALGKDRPGSPLMLVAGLAILGFTAALIIQGKGWPYHGFPAVTLALLVACIFLVGRLSDSADSPDRTKTLSIEVAFAAVLLTGVYALASFWFLQEISRAKLVTEVSRLVPAHPKVVSIYNGPGIAFPLTRKLHGTTLGRTPFQWVSAFTDRLLTTGALDPSGNQIVLDPATRAMLQEYGRLDRAELADAIRMGHPDVILIGGKTERLWAFSHPEIFVALHGYRREKTVDEVEIWLPRTNARNVPLR